MGEGGVGRWQERLRRFFELEGTSDRLRSMEGLRGIAVTLVFFVHFEALFGGWVTPGTASARAANFLATVGHTGADLFFVLSGYLIYGAILKMRESQGGYATFMRRRVRRIYPTFLVMLAIYLALSIVLPSESKLPAGRGAALVYLIENALLLPILFRVTPLITVSWSLSYEVFYYATIPLLVGVFGMRRWQPRTRVQWIGVAALAAFLPVAFVVVTGRVPGLPAADPGRHIACAVWLFVVLFVLTLVAFRAPGPLRELFSVAPLRWLGNMSYSYYLMHALALKGLALAFARLRPGWNPGATGHWLLLPLAFAVTLVSSAGLFAAVEKRFSLAPRRTRSGAQSPALTLDAASAH